MILLRSLSVGIGKNSEGSTDLKEAKLHNCDGVQTLIEIRSSRCILKISDAQTLQLDSESAANVILVYGFGNQKMPAMTPVGRNEEDIDVDDIKG
ncbi:uncharacterized protein NPIL_334931 [Nephila pilipes]|uniref:Uncharacterized protein n=1 Tax=Nephila pilipes TaxID=299642 RepID=A0A8X6NHC7_NEPPI|nr:uncharacterized protein NPIL_334931 [Nephila pilipes]